MIPGSKLKPMVLPQGSQKALEALTPAPRGRQMVNVIQSSHVLKKGPPFATAAKPDGSRWAGVSKDATGGAAASGWIAEAMRRRAEHTTTTDMPTVSQAEAVLKQPSKDFESVKAPPSSPALAGGSAKSAYVAKMGGALAGGSWDEDHCGACGTKKRKRAAPKPDGSAMRRAALVSRVMKQRGIKSLTEASRLVKSEGLKW